MEKIRKLLENNRSWSDRVVADDADFFRGLAQQQNPDYLWIGCSDSRVSANVIVDLAPGEIFVHRNVANLVNHTDMNCLSVIQFAVEVLQVEHIIVCGHYGCGGVAAALDGKRHGLIDNWLRHIQDTAHLYADELAAITSNEAKIDRLCELNVVEQVISVAETTIIGDAWKRGQDVKIHGWIYGLKDGLIRELGISICNENDLERSRKRFLLTDERHDATTASK
ncbi:MAG: carbonate dehydratase [Acidobacteria bacterium]|nr:carbonate dehydratase [Acidobacteriota bacterium]